MLYQNEIPVAYSMVAIAEGHAEPQAILLHSYMCLWIALNNIYTTLASRTEYPSPLQVNVPTKGPMASPRQVPPVGRRFPSEKTQLLLLIERISAETSRALIRHKSTAYFEARTPYWHGQKVMDDGAGNRLNGVINVGRTEDPAHPIWNGIDPEAYRRFGRELGTGQDLRLLTRQIVLVLYTIRNNLFHGGKLANAENDMEVVEKATPLLKILVLSFMQEAG